MTDAPEIGLADVGQGKVPRGAIHEPRAEMLLEIGDEARDDGRRQVELAGRGGKAAFVDDAGEYTHGVQSIH